MFFSSFSTPSVQHSRSVCFFAMYCGIFPARHWVECPKEMATVREAFLSRVRSLMEVLNHSSNFDDGNIDNILTHGNLLYHHAVRLASVYRGGCYDSLVTSCRRFALWSRWFQTKLFFSTRSWVQWCSRPKEGLRFVPLKTCCLALWMVDWRQRIWFSCQASLHCE